MPLPEQTILLCCARTRLEQPWADRLAAALTANVDWASLLRQAGRHGLVPLLHHHLHIPGAGHIPEPVLAELAQAGHANAQSSLFLTGELLRLLDEFAAAAIPVIPYKGPLLALAAYGNLAFRQMSDVDLLVQRNDILPASELLLRLGFHRDQPLNPVQERFGRAYAYTFDFLHPVTGLRVELHWAPVPRYFAIPWDEQGVWARARTTAFMGRPLLASSPEDTLLMLCLHGLKSAWPSLSMVCDIRQWIAAHPALDWDTLLARATAWRSRRVLMLGLQLAQDLLEADLPQPVRQSLASDRVAPQLSRQVQHQLFAEATHAATVASIPFLNFRCQSGLWNRLVCLLSMALTPSLYDISSVPLPALLFPLYYLVRPVRMTWKYGLALAARGYRFFASTR